MGETLLGMSGRGMSRAFMAGAVANLDETCLVMGLGLLLIVNTAEASLQVCILLTAGHFPKPLSCGFKRADL